MLEEGEQDDKATFRIWLRARAKLGRVYELEALRPDQTVIGPIVCQGRQTDRQTQALAMTESKSALKLRTAIGLN